MSVYYTIFPPPKKKKTMIRMENWTFAFLRCFCEVLGWQGRRGEEREPASFRCRAGSAWAVAAQPCSSGIAGDFFSPLCGDHLSCLEDRCVCTWVSTLAASEGSLAAGGWLCSTWVKNNLDARRFGLRRPADDKAGPCGSLPPQAGFSAPWRTRHVENARVPKRASRFSEGR